MHKRNMVRNKYTHGLVAWDVYWVQLNITTSIYMKSQVTYFSEYCAGSVQNQTFWKPMKLLLTSKQPSNNNIKYIKNDKIVTDEWEIYDFVDDFYFSDVAMDIKITRFSDGWLLCQKYW